MDIHDELLKRGLADPQTEPLIDEHSGSISYMMKMMLEDETLSEATKLEAADLLYRLNRDLHSSK